MPYDRNRAIELGTLIDHAYLQYGHLADSAFNWEPAGYTIVSSLTVTAPLAPALPFGYVATKGATLYVVIRGTEKPLEWLDDATILPQPFRPGWGNSTQGFLSIYNHLSPQIIGAIQPLKAAGAYTAIFVTGHSLGASLAHLAAADIVMSLGDVPTSYTFCGPRTGDAGFVNAYQASDIETWRIFNTEDIVPYLPLASLDLNSDTTGLQDIAVILALKVLQHPGQLAFTHLQSPVAVTFNRGSLADNHNLSNVYGCL